MIRADTGGALMSVCGTGTLLETDQHGQCILTCAHVVNGMRGRGQYLAEHPGYEDVFHFNLPSRSGDKVFNARIVEWWPAYHAGKRNSHPISDIALLQVVSDIPDTVRVYSPDDFVVDDLDDRTVKAFGFPDDENNYKGNGKFASGRLMGQDTTGWLQFEGDENSAQFIVPGFSGAPLFNSKKTQILGMVVSISTSADDTTYIAYAQPTQHLWTGCPQLARPYRGLLEFEERDQKFFFGRGSFVTKLRSRLRDHPIVGITAASGSGKSSVVKAGLIPKLRAERNWCVVPMRPDKDPWLELARGLLPILRQDLARYDETVARQVLAEQLRSNPDHLVECLRDKAVADPHIDHILIFVDQFEELFTAAGHDRYTSGQGQIGNVEGENTSDASVAQQDFRDLMLQSASLDGAPSIQWIYTLRADFSGPAYRHSAFVEALREGDEKLADMSEAELRQAIIRPAKKLEVSFEIAREDGVPSVSERIADAVTARPGSLPLMAHLLEKLWERLNRREISHEAYDALGGLEGALNKHANDVYAKLSDKEQMLMRRLFSRLIKISDDGEPTRRVQSRKDLGEELWTVTAPLIKHRLLVARSGGDLSEQTIGNTDTTESIGSETTEVAHEALLRHWEKLQKWLQEDMAFLLWRQRLEAVMREWHLYKADSQLLADGALHEANGWAKGPYRHDLAANEISFIKKSAKIQKQREEEKETTSQMLLDEANARFVAEKRRVKILRIFGGIVGLLVVAIFAGGTWFITEISKKEQEAVQDADRYSIAVASSLLDNDRRPEALLVARERLVDKSFEEIAEKKIDLMVQLRSSVLSFDAVGGMLVGHENAVTDAAFSLDGNFVATVSWDKHIKLWDASNRRLVHTFIGHKNRINSVEFSIDGTRILTASFDNTARIWDTLTGDLVHTLDDHNGNVISAKFSQDGKFVVTASADGNAIIWDSFTGIVSHKLVGHTDLVRYAKFSTDGTYVVTASVDGTARKWVSSTGKQLYEMAHQNAEVTYASFSRNGNRIVTASVDSAARVWDALTGDLLHLLDDHTGEIWHAEFSNDGKQIVAASENRTATVWDSSTGLLIHRLEGHGDEIKTAKFSSDGKLVLTASRDAEARIWDVATGFTKYTLKGHTGELTSASFSPTGTHVVTASADKTARLWTTATGSPSNKLASIDGLVRHAEFSQDNKRIVVSTQKGSVQVWDIGDMKEAYGLVGHSEAVWSAKFSADGSRIVTASDDGTARVWDGSTGAPLHILEFPDGGVSYAEFSKDGSRIVTLSGDGLAQVWESSTGNVLYSLDKLNRSITHAIFSKNGNHLITASLDGTARIWDSSNGMLIHELSGHKKRILHVEFSKDGALVVTASEDGTALIWDRVDGVLLQTLTVPVGGISHAAFSQDNARVVTASGDQIVRIWDRLTETLIQTLEGHSANVRKAEFSHDDKHILTIPRRGPALLWDAKTYRVLLELNHQYSIPVFVGFSSTGDQLIVSSFGETDGTFIRDVGTYTPKRDKQSLVVDQRGKLLWDKHSSFSQGLLDRAAQLVLRDLTKQERNEILKER